MPRFFHHDKKNEVLIHECSKRGSISWKNMPKCISGPTLVITSSGAIAEDGETKVHLPWLFHILIYDFGRWTRSVKFVCRLHQSPTLVTYIIYLQKVTVASIRIGTRGNPSSPPHSGVSDPERILREAKRKLDLPWSSSPQHSSDTIVFLATSFDTQEERKSFLSVVIPDFAYFNPT